MVILFSFTLNGLLAQIHIKNGSFEVADSCFGFSYVTRCVIDSFYNCEPYVSLQTSTSENLIYVEATPQSAYHGNQFISIGFDDTAVWYPGGPVVLGVFSQKLDCYLEKNRTYMFSLAATSVTALHPSSIFKQRGHFLIWGGIDSCDRSEVLYRSPLLDFSWQVLQVNLTPRNNSYNYIAFGCDTSVAISGGIFLDSLSDIYPYNAHAVTIATNDTTLVKGNSCVELRSVVGTTDYDSVYWYSVPAGFHSDMLLPGIVCPDSTTTYIVAVHDTGVSCAGTWWSYDTVTVRVDTTTGVTLIADENEFNLYPDLIKNNGYFTAYTSAGGTIWFYDLLGKLVYERKIEEGSNRFDCSQFNCGNNMLIYQARLNNGKMETGKVIITQ
jgi:hypothetical protein